LDLDERYDHYLGLEGANIVATEPLLMLRDNLLDVIEAKAMMCVHGDAGLGKTPLAGRNITLITYDTTMATKARHASLKVIKLSQP
jgi:hypothetical protein